MRNAQRSEEGAGQSAQPIRGAAAPSHVGRLPADRHRGRRRGHRAGRVAALGGHDVEIADLRAWLTTVVSRLGLDRLRSAAHRRETYVGHWLPEPVVHRARRRRPLSAVVADEDARFAAMVVLERLVARPAGRVRAARRIRPAIRRSGAGVGDNRRRRPPAGLASPPSGQRPRHRRTRPFAQRSSRQADGGHYVR